MRLLTKQNNTAEPVEVAFRDDTLVRRIGEGADVDIILGAYQARLDDQKFTTDMKSIWDLSACNLRRVAVSENRRLVGSIREFMPRRGSRFKAALVTRRPVDYQPLRTYLVVLPLVGNLQPRFYRRGERGGVARRLTVFRLRRAVRSAK